MRVKKQLYNLYEACFPEETEQYRQYFFRHIYRRKNAFFACKEKTVVSAFHVRKRRMRIAGRDFCLPFIVAVGTLPEFRSQGLMGGVMENALRSLRRSADFATLSTYNKHAYYKKFGFVTYSFLTPAVVKGDSSYHAEEVFAPSVKAAKTLAALYRGYTEGKNGYIIRSERDFLMWQRELFADGGRLFLIYLEGNAAGYIYRDKDEYPEFVFKEGNMSCAPMEFSGIEINLPHPTGMPQNMIRLLSPVSALQKIFYHPSAKDAVVLRLTDGLIEKNNTTIRLSVDGGRGRVQKTVAKPSFTLTTEALAALIMGVAVDADERLKKLFCKQQAVVLDRY